MQRLACAALLFFIAGRHLLAREPGGPTSRFDTARPGASAGGSDTIPSLGESEAFYVFPKGRSFRNAAFPAGNVSKGSEPSEVSLPGEEADPQAQNGPSESGPPGIKLPKDGDGAPLRFADEVAVLRMAGDGDVRWFLCLRDGDLFYLPETHLTGPARTVPYDREGNLVIGRELIDSTNGVPIRYEPGDLEIVPPRYGASGYEGRVLNLRREARENFIALIEGAEREGVNMRILSAYRTARYQSLLYENAFARYGLLQNRVAKPGHSEHQLGTTCDLTTDEIRNGLSWEFESTKAFAWLKENGHKYGIFLSYPKYGERHTGYIYEPWHYRYFGKEKWTGRVTQNGVFLGR